MRERTVVFVVAVLAAGMLAAAADVDVRTMAGVDFSAFETYAWTSHDYLDKASPLREGAPLDTKIRSAADKLLASRGFQRVSRDQSPDLLINYVGMADDYFQVEGVTKEIAPGIKWIGDPNAHSMRSYREGTLVFEVVDTDSGDMVWSGWVSELAPTVQKLQDKAEKATQRVFRNFPSR